MKCAACKLKGIDTEMIRKDEYKGIVWYVCNKHYYPFYSTTYKKIKQTKLF